MNICPVTGKPCDRPMAFAISEKLGDLSQTTTCCRNCAEQHIQFRNDLANGISSNTQQYMITIDQFISNFIDKTAIDPNEKRCGCGMSFSDVKSIGRLGCQQCYITFDTEIRDFQSRVNKSTKAKKNIVRVDTLPVDEQIEILENSMKAAIDREDYENAASFRDLLNKIKDSKSKKDL